MAATPNEPMLRLMTSGWPVRHQPCERRPASSEVARGTRGADANAALADHPSTISDGDYDKRLELRISSIPQQFGFRHLS